MAGAAWTELIDPTSSQMDGVAHAGVGVGYTARCRRRVESQKTGHGEDALARFEETMSPIKQIASASPVWPGVLILHCRKSSRDMALQSLDPLHRTRTEFVLIIPASDTRNGGAMT